jgi:quinoprotein glucose dehydrogenase
VIGQTADATVNAAILSNLIPLHAFDSKTGKLPWEGILPYAGNATPITYMANSKQYVVVGDSGGRDRRGPQGTAFVAFALEGTP